MLFLRQPLKFEVEMHNLILATKVGMTQVFSSKKRRSLSLSLRVVLLCVFCVLLFLSETRTKDVYSKTMRRKEFFFFF